MKTKLKNGSIIDWDKVFDSNTSTKEETCDFAENRISGKQWIDNIWTPDSKKAARQMIREFGVKGTRSRAQRWAKQFD